MIVQPAPGRLVRDPITKQHLPAEGAPVPATPYWLRRLRAGDVVEIQPTAAPAAELVTEDEEE